VTALAAAKGSFTTAAEQERQSIDGFGFRPVAVIAWWGCQSTAGTKRANRGGVGFWTATDSGSVTWSSADGETVSRTAQLSDEAALIGLDGAEPGIAMRARVESFDEDGLTLRYLVQPSKPWIVHFLALGGPAVEDARVGWMSPRSTKSLDDTGLVLLTPVPAESGIVTRGLALGIGARASRGRAVAGYLNPDGGEPGSVTGAQRSGTPFLEWPGERRESDRFCYLRVEGLHARIGTDVSRAGTGTRHTRVGFRPDAVILFSWGLRRSPDWNTMGRFCLGAVAGDQSGCMSWDDRDGDLRETLTHVRSSSDHALIVADSQSDDFHARASLASIDDDGFTLNWTSDKAGREFVYVALTDRYTRGRVSGVLARIRLLSNSRRIG
jgi:hypothetical protein